MGNIVTRKRLPWHKLSDEDFENLCYDLLSCLGFTNLDWRQGGQDQGRDIEAARLVKEPGGYLYQEQWFVECKKYERGVPIKELQSKIAWADAENPDYLLIITSGYLTTATKNWLRKVQEGKKYRVRYWEWNRLEQLLSEHSEIIEKYFFSEALVDQWVEDYERYHAVPDIERYQKIRDISQHANLSGQVVGLAFIALLDNQNGLFLSGPRMADDELWADQWTYGECAYWAKYLQRISIQEAVIAMRDLFDANTDLNWDQAIDDFFLRGFDTEFLLKLLWAIILLPTPQQKYGAFYEALNFLLRLGSRLDLDMLTQLLNGVVQEELAVFSLDIQSLTKIRGEILFALEERKGTSHRLSGNVPVATVDDVLKELAIPSRELLKDQRLYGVRNELADEDN